MYCKGNMSNKWNHGYKQMIQQDLRPLPSTYIMVDGGYKNNHLSILRMFTPKEDL